MASRQLRTALEIIRGSLHAGGSRSLSDAHLLQRWTNHHDEVAFELLVRRHGPMVFALCRRLLSRLQDAEDAFQATFLVLVRRAGAIRKQTALGSWLYKVAYRVALRARQRPALQLSQLQADAIAGVAEPVDQAMWDDLRPVLDEEVHRLPPRFREVFVLCQLEGKTNEEAAQELGCPLGTVVSRLSRARSRLRKQLARRGVAVTAVALAALVAQHASGSPPALLVGATVRHALGAAGVGGAAAAVPTGVSSLCNGVLRAMLMTKIKIGVAIALLIGLTGLGGGVASYRLNARETQDNSIEIAAAPEAAPDGAQQAAAGQPADDKAVVKGSVAPVWSLAVSPEGRWLIAEDKNGSAKMWRVVGGKKTPPGGGFRLVFRGPDNLDRLIKDLQTRQKSYADCIDALYLAALGRYPNSEEQQALAARLIEHQGTRQAALEDALSQLTHSKEFGQHLLELHQRNPNRAQFEDKAKGPVFGMSGVLDLEGLRMEIVADGQAGTVKSVPNPEVLTVQPPAAEFRKVTRGAVTIQKIVIQSKQPLRIESVRTSSPRLQVEWDEETTTRHEITLRFDSKQANNGEWLGQVLLETSLPSVKTITIPVRATVAP